MNFSLLILGIMFLILMLILRYLVKDSDSIRHKLLEVQKEIEHIDNTGDLLAMAMWVQEFSDKRSWHKSHSSFARVVYDSILSKANIISKTQSPGT